jgi:DNA polymerase III delta prime subunit
MSIERLWVEKYRPSTLDNVIFCDEQQKQKFLSYKKQGFIPNLLLSGTQGSGKTTISRALIKDLGIHKADVMYINASDETSVDVVRDKIKNFVSTMPVGNFKIVRLEEFDYFSLAAQGALRVLTENYSDTVRFILTCNYENKIIPPIKSRFTHVQFKAPAYEDVLLRMGEILFDQNIDFDADELELIVKMHYPDIRNTIVFIEDNSKTGVLKMPKSSSTGSTADFKLSTIDLVKENKYDQLRQLVRTSVPKEEYEEFFRILFEGIKATYKNKPDILESMLITLNEYVFKHSVVTLPELNVEAMLISLGKEAANAR